ncbi:MAG: NAD(P)H-hydrate dehydratase [Acutalibacteraceae bacterium]|nr:NAD(P)H-hydrate dehydratase [Acutalibacteraceae bacterium]
MDIKVIKQPMLPPRDKNSHKGTFGTAVLICGSYGMAGAAVLAGKAALRSGLGIAKIILPDKIYDIAARQIPEAVFVPLKTSLDGTLCGEDIPKICEHIKGADSLLFGCGSGRSHDNAEILKALIENTKCPFIIDADGINLLSQNIDIIKQTEADIILTPHPGEMSRLTGKSIAEIEADRIKTARAFTDKYGAVTVLKGAETVVATKNDTYLNTIGNAGMATGGSGDTLSGILAAFLAREKDIDLAVTAAVWVHSAAGDAAAKRLSQTSMLPSDMIDELPCLFKKLEG